MCARGRHIGIKQCTFAHTFILRTLQNHSACAVILCARVYPVYPFLFVCAMCSSNHNRAITRAISDLQSATRNVPRNHNTPRIGDYFRGSIYFVQRQQTTSCVARLRRRVMEEPPATDDQDEEELDLTLTAAVTKIAPKDDKHVKARKQRERNVKQFDLINACTIADVVLNAAAPTRLKGSGESTPITSINGACPNMLAFNTLRQFMTKNNIQNYRGKNKGEILKMIVKAKENEGLDTIMYGEDYIASNEDEDKNEEGIATEEGDASLTKNGTRPLKKLSKRCKPREISQDGSLYRIILVYFLQELRPYVNQLGANPIPVQLGTPRFLHESIYDRIASVYNDSTRDDLNSFLVNHEVYITVGVSKDAPATFEELSGLAVLQSMDFINKYYRQAKRKQTLSGNHKPFHHDGRPYLMLYHESLTETGDKILSALAVPELPESAKRNSLKATKASALNSSSSAEKKKRSNAVLDGLLEVSHTCYASLLSFFKDFTNNHSFLSSDVDGM